MKAFLYKISAALVAYGPWGVFVLGIVDSFGVPLPAAMDLLLVGIGAGSVSRPGHAYFAALLAVLGSVGGNLGLFLAAKGGARWLARSESTAEKRPGFRQWFARYGMLTVFVPALLPAPPLPLKVFVISAGVLRYSLVRFLAVIVLARSLRYFGEVYLGLTLGKDAPEFLTRHGWTLAGVVLLLSLALWVVMRVLNRREQAV
jgi:membrane protein YqaA with SNARE-associated domain